VKFTILDPPRTFEVGLGQIVHMRDCAHVALAPDEQLTLFTEAGAELDVARKEWGFYATPSLNNRLSRFGLRGALLRNRLGHYFIVLVESGQESRFMEYTQIEQLHVTTWLDESGLARIEDAFHR
jgi:hypothetical protein